MFQINIITIFPEAFPGALDVSLLGKAKRNTKWKLNIVDLKKHSNSKNKIDDTPYGGGPGMIIRADVLQSAFDEVKESMSAKSFKKMCKIMLSPRGKRLSQNVVEELSKFEGLIIFCGRYEGVDERFISHNDIRQISIGDFILMGGEVAAMALSESVVRLVPDILGNPKSIDEESFSNGIIEYPQFTKPRVWNKRKVPDVLLSGNHRKIKDWRSMQSRLIMKKNKKTIDNF